MHYTDLQKYLPIIRQWLHRFFAPINNPTLTGTVSVPTPDLITGGDDEATNIEFVNGLLELRAFALARRTGTTVALTNGSPTPVIFNSIQGVAFGYDPNTGIFTAIANGWYRFSGCLGIESDATTGNFQVAIQLYLEGAFKEYMFGDVYSSYLALSGYKGIPFVGTIYMNQGEEADVRVFTNRTTGSYTRVPTGAGLTHLFIERVK